MKKLGIYIHIPFCIRKCQYCDFLSFPLQGEEWMERYLEALLNEIQFRSRRMTSYRVNTIFLGGGTPSLLSGQQAERLFTVLRKCFSMEKDAEITMEANPGTVTRDKLACFAECGINRLSFGLQSAREKELKLLGRIHRKKEFEQSISYAREVGISNINADLMSALPGQSVEDFLYSLEYVLSFQPEHISAYSLMIEEGTPFYEYYHEDVEKRDRGGETMFLPSEETEREIYHRTEECLERAGFEHYEISNYARPGKRCEHNMGCWKRVDYAGFGLGASSFLENVRMSNIRDLEDYLRKEGQDCVEERLPLSLREQMEEFFFLGLRLKEGVSLLEFEECFHQSAMEVFGEVLGKYLASGHLISQAGRIFFSSKGRDVANYILSGFLCDD